MKIGQLIQGIKQLEDRSSTGELAFLCLNGKSENHIRDLISFNIARNKPKWKIEREINQIDLRLTNTKGAEQNIEFKIGYTSGVINQKETSAVLSSALKDIEKRSVQIISCIGVMDFKCDNEEAINRYRNAAVIKRTLNDATALRKSKKIIKDIWSSSRCRFTNVNCGNWDGIEVVIMFCTIQHA